MSNIDVSVLQSLLSLQEKVGKELLKPLLETFSTSLTEQVPKMRIAFLAKRHDELGAIAHSLKSSAANIGAIEMSQNFYRVEFICEQESPKGESEEELIKIINKTESTYQQTVNELKAAVENLTADAN